MFIRRTHTAKLVERRMVAKGTMAFYFDKPDGVCAHAGQFVDLTLSHLSEPD